MLKTQNRRKFSPGIDEMEPRMLLNAGYIVTNVSDANVPGSLRWAITQSNNTPSTPQAPNVISFLPGLSGAQISNAHGPLVITDSVSIYGSHQTIDGRGVSQIFRIVGANTGVNLVNLVMANGQADGNRTIGNDAFGGAVENWGSGVGLFGDTFVNDHASSLGGAVFSASGVTWVGGSTFTGNSSNGYGGAIFESSEATLVMMSSPSIFYLNDAGYHGGAVAVKHGHYLPTVNVSYVGNSPDSLLLY